MDKIATGVIRTAHGVSGFLKVASFSGESEHFFTLKSIELRHPGKPAQVFVVEQVKPYKGGVLIKLSGIETPEKAKHFNGWEIWVDRQDAAVKDDGEYYHAELCGCDLVYQGSIIGRVAAVARGASSDFLEVELDGTTRWIPFLDEFIGTVSLEDRTIELRHRWIVE